VVSDAPAPTARPGLATSAARLERLGVLLLLAVALVPRLRDVAAPFDREAEGAQAAFFAIAAVNHERLGLRHTGGYPVLNVDATDPGRRGAGAPIASRHWLFYTNHPPLVPLLAWAALEALGPRGWDTAWREHRAPAGIELPLRLPFLAAHLLFLWSLWWAARQSGGPRAALIALGLGWRLDSWPSGCSRCSSHDTAGCNSSAPSARTPCWRARIGSATSLNASAWKLGTVLNFPFKNIWLRDIFGRTALAHAHRHRHRGIHFLPPPSSPPECVVFPIKKRRWSVIC
jgi:hypothetical protein